MSPREQRRQQRRQARRKLADNIERFLRDMAGAMNEVIHERFIQKQIEFHRAIIREIRNIAEEEKDFFSRGMRELLDMSEKTVKRLEEVKDWKDANLNTKVKSRIRKVVNLKQDAIRAMIKAEDETKEAARERLGRKAEELVKKTKQAVRELEEEIARLKKLAGK